MLQAAVVFLVVTGAIVGGYLAATQLPGLLAERRLRKRLEDLSAGPVGADLGDAKLVMRPELGPLPAIERLMARTSAGLSLTRLIEQAGMRTTPSAVLLISAALAGTAGLVALLFTGQWMIVLVAAAIGGILPTGFLVHRRSVRLRRFEEQFPEALDLLSRALRAGHAFQSGLGMVADELKAPVGPEFKKTFDQQNYGLPLRDALNQMTERIPLLDVRFFVTAVLIQRETGGNLSEILDNLAHVVRERFKILRQVRVHTAHGRFTGFVLLSLPAALAVLLTFINPDHMGLLFTERMGQIMLVVAIVMQAIGFVWIRKVIKIEV
jgi:tight adherence protein B